ncbi:MAG: hypothetical protein GY953_02335, partial [bacterium]|nr:hypothetical protein [bacterium]
MNAGKPGSRQRIQALVAGDKASQELTDAEEARKDPTSPFWTDWRKLTGEQRMVLVQICQE